MNRSLRPISACISVISLLAFVGAAEAQIATPQVELIRAHAPFSAEELERLVGPVALYPDPLLAQVLPASTYPLDIVRAARLVRSGATPGQIEEQDWDPSVKAVAHYAGVLEMMDTSIDWTQQLGEAFMAQPGEVMQAIQRLRVRANALGNLVSVPQQQIVIEGDAVRIFPAQAEYICVPSYDPAFVYYQRRPFDSTFVSFGLGIGVGSWLDLDLDWHDECCYRPGWTWNHWRDHVEVEHGRVVRFERPDEHRRESREAERWRRDDQKPSELHGRHVTRPSEFDEFRGREHAPGATPMQPIRPMEPDRGRDRTPTPRQPAHVFDPRQPEPQTRTFEKRGAESRATTPAFVGPVAKPGSVPAAPAPRPQPAPQPAPKPQPQPMGPVSKIAPPPVNVAPPPTASFAIPPPPLTTGGPATQRGDKDRGRK